MRSAQVSEAKDHLRGKSEIVECARELFGDGKVQDVPGAVEGPSATPNTKGNGSGRSQA
ncbi:hypothetical protein [Wolbachia endosymbiont of Ctenocephalides felis wCfeT]|uniref:hypothetical protein n=1 Tax=Wolbachia endosymbiont of Ctenocephalides felis wCfeT TaxID=2732593 RepID=UPI0014476758|nr:hypothetical protein [Wolbachia endosymbiont of Ctenocephalides felis wCfeT]